MAELLLLYSTSFDSTRLDSTRLDSTLDATLLYYLTEEAKEGKQAFLEKRSPDFSKFPRFP